MRRRRQRAGWRTWVLGAVGAAVAGAVLASRSEKLRELRARARLRLAGGAGAPGAEPPATARGGGAHAAIPSNGATQGEPTSVPAAAPPAPAVEADGPWVASRLGSTYYRADCRSALRLAAAHRVTFATEAEAQAAGLRRSTADGC